MKTILKSSMFSVIILSIAAAAICEGAAANDKPELAALVEGNTEFALDLYRQLKNRQGNIFFSPFSISTALAMTYEGARGNTATEMAQTLHFTIGEEKIPAAFFQLETKLNEIRRKGEVKLFVANSLWPQIGYPFQKDYLALMKQDFGVSITPVDYAQNTETSREIINKWVEGKTEEKIVDLIGRTDLSKETVLVLVNAIYFKGNWASRFNPKLTRDEDFILADGKKKKVPLMRQTEDFGLRETDELQILELPYVGKEISMFIILPRELDGLDEIEETISGEKVQSWLTPGNREKVMVYLPKFKITWGTFDLKKSLMALGMKDAFLSGKADFTGMSKIKDLYISLVLHKAFIEVNEEGSEAAAATAVVINRSASRPPIFRADHPFLFLIRDNNSKSILFLGRVTDPGMEK